MMIHCDDVINDKRLGSTFLYCLQARLACGVEVKADDAGASSESVEAFADDVTVFDTFRLDKDVNFSCAWLIRYNDMLVMKCRRAGHLPSATRSWIDRT